MRNNSNTEYQTPNHKKISCISVLSTPKKQEVGLIERYGSGIRRVINICKDHGIIEPAFEEKPNGFMVTNFKEELKEDGKTKRIGPAKGGHWQIIEK